MPRRVVEITVAYPGGPPLIAIPDVAEGKPPVCWKSASRIDILRVPLQGIILMTLLLWSILDRLKRNLISSLT